MMGKCINFLFILYSPLPVLPVPPGKLRENKKKYTKGEFEITYDPEPSRSPPRVLASRFTVEPAVLWLCV